MRGDGQGGRTRVQQNQGRLRRHGQKTVQVPYLMEAGQVQRPALLGCVLQDALPVSVLPVEAPGVRGHVAASGPDRPEIRDPQLRGLLHHQIHGAALEQPLDQVEAGLRLVLLAEELAHLQHGGPGRSFGERG